jgi:segregation and condensation protein B
MSLKAKVEAIIYAAEEPVTLEQMSLLLKDVVLADLASARENLAIEQADSAAEAAAEAASVDAEESALLPEIAIESAELISPEPGPLMPEEASSERDSQPESQEVNSASESTSSTNSSPADETSEEGTAQELVTASSVPDAQSEPAPQDFTSGPVSEEATLPTDQESSAITEPDSAESATVAAPETASRKRQPKKTEAEIAEDKAVRARVREVLVELVTDYANEDRGMEIRQVAGGFRMATKPEHHDVVRAFAKSLKPPIRLSLAALETLAVVAYKQPITGPEISDIRGVESASVLGTLLDRKLITTAGRKQVIGRPMQYKTSKDFLLRFGLNDVNELPSMEEFSQLASDGTIEITPTEPQETPSLFEPETQNPNTGSTEEAVETTESAADNLEAGDAESSLPEPEAMAEPQPSNAEAADSQPQSEAESSNVPEAEHPIGSN